MIRSFSSSQSMETIVIPHQSLHRSALIQIVSQPSSGGGSVRGNSHKSQAILKTKGKIIVMITFYFYWFWAQHCRPRHCCLSRCYRIWLRWVQIGDEISFKWKAPSSRPLVFIELRVLQIATTSWEKCCVWLHDFFSVCLILCLLLSVAQLIKKSARRKHFGGIRLYTNTHE